MSAPSPIDHPLASSSDYKKKSKTLPFTHIELREAARKYPTPFHFYDEKTIRSTCKKLNDGFRWVEGESKGDKSLKGFMNYFAVKALPNVNILDILNEEGFGMDCSSLPELELCESLGIRGERVMFTSNNMLLKSYRKAKEMGAIINLDDISHVDYVHSKLGLPELLCFRYNPGSLRESKTNAIIGKPEEAKFGLTTEQIFDAYKLSQQKGVKRFGLHTMVVSNCLALNEVQETARMVFTLVIEIYEKLGIRMEFVNLGGGIGVPYLCTQSPIDFEELGCLINKEYNDIILPHANIHPLRVVFENGRCITGPAGCLLTRVIHQKDTYRKYVGVDTGIQNLMRPALYGSYHHMTVVPCDDYASIQYEGGEKLELPEKRNLFKDVDADTVYDVVGSLCENNDKLAEQRSLGVVRIGDLIAIHDTGAHGHCMGFNYNFAVRSGEYLRLDNGSIRQIRRAETYGDLVRTVVWPKHLPLQVKETVHSNGNV